MTTGSPRLGTTGRGIRHRGRKKRLRSNPGGRSVRTMTRKTLGPEVEEAARGVGKGAEGRMHTGTPVPASS
eukprot:8357075-Heterocapsa_arctica.AAC.1